jgi:hypothetical protein
VSTLAIYYLELGMDGQKELAKQKLWQQNMAFCSWMADV